MDLYKQELSLLKRKADGNIIIFVKRSTPEAWNYLMKHIKTYRVIMRRKE